MIKAILVDDEPIILNNLKNNYSWAEMGVEIVATSQDGDEAFEVICDLLPDLIITDIKMPRMDGIELIRLLQKANVYPKVIFATGYSDFEYTREAIRLGAFDYILKPFSPDELSDTVKKCVAEIHNLQAKMNNESRSIGELQLFNYFNTENKDYRKKEFKKIERQITDLYELSEIRMNVIHTLPKVEASTGKTSEEDCMALIRRLNFSLGLEDYFAFSPRDNHSIIILTFRTSSKLSKTDFDMANKNYMKTLQEAFLENLGLDVPIHCFNKTDYAERDTLDVESLYTVYMAYMQDFDKVSTVDNDMDDNSGKRYVQDALDFISDHYGEQIKIHDVSDHVYLSESHFSNLFNKQMGMNFSKYLAKFRIEKSKEYMKQFPYAKIYEISCHVGYTDARYFSTLFKKIEGITPSKYMNSLF